jgi:hypothetical protein
MERACGAGDAHAAGGLEGGQLVSRFGVHVGTFVRARPRRKRKTTAVTRAAVS